MTDSIPQAGSPTTDRGLDAATRNADSERTEYWRSLLSGEDPDLRKLQRRMERMPAAPRCKLCRAPFHGWRAPILRTLGFRPWKLNQQMCAQCFRRMEKHPGGAEIELSIVYADVRNSTAMAEREGASAFTNRLNQFYSVVLEAVEAEHGIVDHMAGDGVMAMWIPAFAGGGHANRAIAAGRRIASTMASDTPVGVAVHTGIARVGVVGVGGAQDFTALGDAPNTAARLSSESQQGETLISASAAHQADLDTSTMRSQSLELRGKGEPIDVWVEAIGESS